MGDGIDPGQLIAGQNGGGTEKWNYVAAGAPGFGALLGGGDGTGLFSGYDLFHLAELEIRLLDGAGTQQRRSGGFHPPFAIEPARGFGNCQAPQHEHKTGAQPAPEDATPSLTMDSAA